MNSLLNRLWKISPQKIVSRILPGLARKIDTVGHFSQLASDGIISADELDRLKMMPRYTMTESRLFGRTVSIVDAASYLSMLQEIFTRKNYLFKARTETPFIVDCGANIGLSIIYFKQIYPDATIIAFEPDPNVFKALSANVKSFGFRDVQVHNKAVWDKCSTVTFNAEGSWSGRIDDSQCGTVSNVIEVEAVRLKQIIEGRKIDFLKIDVEGAETDILLDCEELIINIDHIFFEYHSFADKRQSLHKLLRLLYEKDFRYHIKEALLHDNPFVNPVTDGMDMQLDVFAYRTQ